MSPVSLKSKLAATLKVSAPHVVVSALAGTGKTTTIIEGLKLLKGLHSTFTPSPQQALIWEEIQKSTEAKSICFVAFNKSIAKELQSRVPQGCEAMTMHSLGFSAVRSAYGKVKPDSWHTSNLIAEHYGEDIKELRIKKAETINAIAKLVSLVKMNLSDVDEESLSGLCSHYGIELDGNKSEVFEIVPKIIEMSKDVAKYRACHFDDMIWLPVVLGLTVSKYDLLLVDECQDLNRCQQALARKAGKRLILVGDTKQAIYGFAGADAESMGRMIQELGETTEGCVELPLTITRRCSVAVVDEAKKLVPTFDAHESNLSGSVTTSKMDGDTSYRNQVKTGDMILCRVNAPLVGECFKFLRSGKKATIRGRDVAKGLIATVKKVGKSGSNWNASDFENNITTFLENLSDWTEKETSKEMSRKNPNDAKLISLEDKQLCLSCFAEEVGTLGELISKIESIFSDKDEAGIQLSSIHKAKGLEASKVFILQPKGASIPHPMAKTSWAREQEYNLLYVAITRAIDELIFVN